MPKRIQRHRTKGWRMPGGAIYVGRPTAPIPDLTPSAHTMAPCCGAGWRGLVCTRLPGHTGRHAAGDGQHIVAVWADPA